MRSTSRTPFSLRGARRLGRWLAQAYACPDEEISRFVDDAVDDGWRESGVRGVASALVTVALDIIRTRWRSGGLDLQPNPRVTRLGSRTRFMDTFRDDLRYASRRLRRSPMFTAVALTTLALGIGLTTAAYTVVDQSILRPFSFPDTDRLVLLNERFESNQMSVSWPNFLDWHAQARSFQELGVYRAAAVTMTGVDQPERLNGAAMTSAVFDATGLQPILGRRFIAADDAPTATPAVMISERLWRSHFAGAPNVAGRGISLNGVTFTIVGVMPSAMRFPSRLTDVWLSFGSIVLTLPTARDNHPGLSVLGRLRPGVSLEMAATEMEVVARRLEAAHPATNTKTHVTVRAYREVVVQDVRPAFVMLLGAAVLVLLMACANLASLLLARTDSRRQELAVRAALGATRGRLLRQLVTESVLLAGTGGLLGVAFAWAAVRAFVRSGPTLVPRIDLIGVDWPVVAFAVTLSVFTGLLFGSAPAMRAAAAGVRDAVRGGRQGSPARSRTRRLLVVAEVAMAFVLLVGAGLFGRSLNRLLSLDLGFTPDQLVTMQVALPAASYPTVDAWTAFHRRLIDAVSGAGLAAALSSNLPLSGNAAESAILAEGDPMPTADHPPAECSYTVVSSRYFSIMGVELLRGRGFTATDTARSEPVIVLSDDAAARLFPSGDALGKRVAFETRGDTPATLDPIWRVVVGIVHHVRHYGLTGEPPYAEVFTPLEQLPIWMSDRRPAMSLVVRTTTGADTSVATVRRAVQAIDPNLPVFGLTTMAATVTDATEQPRLSLMLVGGFAGLALVLAVLGIYGVLAEHVAQRGREIGLRMALGARRGQVSALILRQAAGLVVVGLAMGLTASVALSRVVSAMLFDISPTDPITLTVVSSVVVLTAACAAAIPSRRAATLDPLLVLRQD